MKRHIALCMGFLAFLISANPAFSADESKPKGPAANVDIKAVIKACEDNAWTDPPDYSTAGMIRFSNRNIACLQEEILTQLRQTMPEPDKAAEQARAHLSRMREDHQSFWHMFYSGNKSCSGIGMCSSMQVLSAYAEHIAFLEGMFKTIVEYRQDEGF